RADRGHEAAEVTPPERSVSRKDAKENAKSAKKTFAKSSWRSALVRDLTPARALGTLVFSLRSLRLLFAPLRETVSPSTGVLVEFPHAPHVSRPRRPAVPRTAGRLGRRPRAGEAQRAGVGGGQGPRLSRRQPGEGRRLLEGRSRRLQESGCHQPGRDGL